VIRVASATHVRPIAGEVVAGDACLVARWSRGLLLAVCDGLGHGPAAAEAAEVFVAHVRAAVEAPLEQLLAESHRELRRTRGAVASIARIDEGIGRVEVAGIGNVTTLVAAAGAPASHVPMPAGVLGGSYRAARPRAYDFGVGDLVVMHTDGVRSRFDLASLRGLSPDRLARAVVGTFGKTSDDAACAVALGAVEGHGRAGRDGGGGDTEPGGGDDPSSLAIAIRLPGDPECCAVGARAFAGRLGFTVRRQWEVSIAVSELATNVLRHADDGVLTLSHVPGPPERVVVEIVDRARPASDVGGPNPHGLPGLGVGLASVHRMMDHVAIEARPEGRRVVAWKYR
jgi:negative regulator of sigma-B (phosphoserine phosphatase)